MPMVRLAMAQFGQWNQILQQPAPSAYLAYSLALWHYSRGLAFTGRSRHSAIERDVVSLRAADRPKISGLCRFAVRLRGNRADWQSGLKPGANRE